MALRLALAALALCASAAAAPPTDACKQAYARHELSLNFNETVAHAIHSMTAADLRIFNPRATGDNNKVPVVNPRLNDPRETEKVLPFAPEYSIGKDFHGDAMNTVDAILSSFGKNDDGLGPHWSPLERIVHRFHMKDLWSKVLDYASSKMDASAILEDDDELCSCLVDVDTNGIRAAVAWIAEHYKSGTPITLLNRPIPKLENAESWAVWRVRLLHYYTDAALRDAALYLHCVTKDM